MPHGRIGGHRRPDARRRRQYAVRAAHRRGRRTPPSAATCSAGSAGAPASAIRSTSRGGACASSSSTGCASRGCGCRSPAKALPRQGTTTKDTEKEPGEVRVEHSFGRWYTAVSAPRSRARRRPRPLAHSRARVRADAARRARPDARVRDHRGAVRVVRAESRAAFRCRPQPGRRRVARLQLVRAGHRATNGRITG